MPAPHLEQRNRSVSTLSVYCFVVFSHSLQNVAQTHIPDSPAQHEELGGYAIFSTVNVAPPRAGGHPVTQAGIGSGKERERTTAKDPDQNGSSPEVK